MNGAVVFFGVGGAETATQVDSQSLIYLLHGYGVVGFVGRKVSNHSAVVDIIPDRNPIRLFVVQCQQNPVVYRWIEASQTRLAFPIC